MLDPIADQPADHRATQRGKRGDRAAAIDLRARNAARRRPGDRTQRGVGAHPYLAHAHNIALRDLVGLLDRGRIVGVGGIIGAAVGQHGQHGSRGGTDDVTNQAPPFPSVVRVRDKHLAPPCHPRRRIGAQWPARPAARGHRFVAIRFHPQPVRAYAAASQQETGMAPTALTQTQTQSQTQSPPADTNCVLQGYDPNNFFCEMLRRGHPPHPGLELLCARLAQFPIETLRRRAVDAERDLLERGITFTVYSDATAIDRILPFDLIPRVITAGEWRQIETGVIQRVRALNMFLHDVYHDRKILADGVVPRELVLGNAGYCATMVGFDVPFNTYVHICGTDIVRDETGRFMVLEDNARTPSGVSYVVENRHMTQRVLSDLMAGLQVRGVDEYGLHLHRALVEISPPSVQDPQVVLLSPGIFNSAYFEHVFLAREMGVPLVEGQDLVVENHRVFMHTTAGLAPVHTIYRRLNDDALDPTVFNPDSMLGVAGMIEAWRRGNVAIANAVGTGVADDKAVYAYMPRIIRYYLAEDPILPNVETNICSEPDALAYTLDHLSELVVKPVAESGGYGLIIGPHATRAQLDDFRARLLANPANYISQPTLKLSVSPTLTEDGVAPRHIDLRPFAVTGRDTWVLPGGLTRVALRAGTLVVNSSQGGGTKDTWVLA
jgi:uncharacterized circularly permuted ATP-grasp superfamily protein